MLSVLFTICMIWFVGKIFYIWCKSILGNHEITLYCYFLSSDIEKEKREAIEAQIVL